MIEVLGAIIVALIGGAAVIFTTGPALGAVRSRRAVREILEIRSALRKRDAEHLARVDALLEQEVRTLVALGDTSRRLMRGTARAIGLLLMGGGIFYGSTLLAPSAESEEILSYIAGACFLAIGIIMAILIPSVTERQESKWGRAKAAITYFGVSALMFGVTAFIVRDTAYADALRKYWEST